MLQWKAEVVSSYLRMFMPSIIQIELKWIMPLMPGSLSFAAFSNTFAQTNTQKVAKEIFLERQR